MSLEVTKIEGGSVFRKIAMGSWRTAGDPSVYGLLEIDCTKALQYIEKIQKDCPYKITISHLVGKAVAHVLKERPEINGFIRHSRIYQRKHVDVFYHINIPGDPKDAVGKATLTGEVVRHVENLSVQQIAEVLDKKAKHIKSGGKTENLKATNSLALVPWQLIYYVLNFTSYLNYDLNLDLRWAGMPRDAFGSVMITNVGGLGVDLAWAPLVPYTKVPLLLTIGAIKDRAWVVDGQVQVRPIMRIGITFDHRFMDGIHASVMQKIFTRCFEEPEKYF